MTPRPRSPAWVTVLAVLGGCGLLACAGWIGLRVLVGVAAVSVPVPVVVPTAVEAPVQVTGAGTMASAPFPIRGGDYAATWDFTNPGDQPTDFSLLIDRATGSSMAISFVNGFFPAHAVLHQPGRAQTLGPGRYFVLVTATSGAAWQFGLVPTP